jgi:hypothetical protein
MRSNRTGRTTETAGNFKVLGGFHFPERFAYFAQFAHLTFFNGSK